MYQSLFSEQKLSSKAYLSIYAYLATKICKEKMLDQIDRQEWHDIERENCSRFAGKTSVGKKISCAKIVLRHFLFHDDFIWMPS